MKKISKRETRGRPRDFDRDIKMLELRLQEKPFREIADEIEEDVGAVYRRFKVVLKKLSTARY